MLIGGASVAARNGATFERRNPLDGAVATRAAAATPEDAVAAETGASALWAGFNVHLAAGMLREAAALTTRALGEVIPSDVPGSLAMGNTVVLKGSENCPRTHSLIIESLQDAGFPKGVVNYVTNAPADAGAVVEAMVAHPAVRRPNFSGSTRVGRIIAQTCAKHLKAAVLELGGQASDTLVPATILDHVTPQMRIYREETHRAAVDHRADGGAAVSVLNASFRELTAPRAPRSPPARASAKRRRLRPVPRTPHRR